MIHMAKDSASGCTNKVSAAAAVRTCSTAVRGCVYTLYRIAVVHSIPRLRPVQHSQARKMGDTASAVLALTLVDERNLDTKQAGGDRSTVNAPEAEFGR